MTIGRYIIIRFNESRVNINLEEHKTDDVLHLPENAKGLIFFVYGKGNSRLTPRNKSVVRRLNKAGFGTLLFDLLTAKEDIHEGQSGEYDFNIGNLTKGLIKVTDWVTRNPQTKGLKIGYFGTSTGAAAALLASVQRPNEIKAIVSRGGRPDLAGDDLRDVSVPTFLIVGGNDFPVIQMNEDAFQKLSVEKKFRIIPKASHFSDEPGNLIEEANTAKDWFQRYLIDKH
jgi:putative phosphoribosyl transferase